MIDWDRVNELQEEVGQEDFEEIVTLFLEEVDEATANLSDMLAGDALADALHFLKGCSLNLGFRELARLCEAGETAARSGTEPPVEVALVKTTYRASRDSFVAGMADMAA